MQSRPVSVHLLLPVLSLLAFGCNESLQTTSLQVASPSGNNSITFMLLEEGIPAYSVYHLDSLLIDTSLLGFDLEKYGHIGFGMEVLRTERDSEDDTWEQPWGEEHYVHNHYNELLVELMQPEYPYRRLNIYFRAYDDGIAFRYEFPRQDDDMDTVVILDEQTQFQLTEDPTVWWTPGDWDIYEHLYNTTKFSKIDALSKQNHPNLAQTYIPQNAVNTPVTMRLQDGVHLTFHEAHLEDYAGMTLAVDNENLLMTSALVGSDRLGYKVKRAIPFETPWRTVQISDDAIGLLNSRMILNLNPPSKIKDLSWFTPMKYAGIWWEMHLDKSTWDMASGRHGATTEHAMELIDFAAANGLKGVLVEGWNTGWEHWIGFEDREGVFDFVTPYADYDLDSVVAYGKSKGVDIIMHHETSAAVRTYDQQLDTAFQLMQSLDLHMVKTGYVGKIIPAGEYHHGQYMVNHYRRVVETAAKYHIAIDAHEPIKDTGERRTWPNFVSREGMRGQEFNAWASDGGNPPEHLPIVAYTRMMAGPFDFTPGVFNLSLKPYKQHNQINTTLAQQLALYVVIYSPVQMACDLPENYAHPAFQFIRDVGVDWEQSIPLNGEVGNWITMAREERGTGNWFVGAITDENARDVQVDFSFLPAGTSFAATVYRDGKTAHYRKDPYSLTIETMTITPETNLTFHLAPGGGLAISLMKETAPE
ncbi:MAG TPA: glycoside hydrolase family 97 protein [Chitinophagales bacterium]|nr:glycoside hydrolase family 97 protein [Chitinophagales bacterium]